MAQTQSPRSDITQQDRDAHVQAKHIKPNWITSADHYANNFWFKRSNAPKDSTFIYVDTSKGSRRPAFNHEAVAGALREQGIDADATNLPFTYIHTDNEFETVKFHAGDKSWEWKKNSTLVETDGDFGEHNLLKPLLEEVPSGFSTKKSSIRFKNNLSEKVSIYWVDYDGKEKHYGDVTRGRPLTQSTYESHVWRVKKTGDGSTIATFSAESEEKTAVIEDGLQAVKPSSETTGTLSKRQSNGTDEGEGAFVKDNNVWYRDVNGQETQMSTIGTAENPFSNLIYYSPNRKFLVVNQLSPPQEHMAYAVESSPSDQLLPRLKQWNYLRPGDKRDTTRPRMFDVTTKKEVPTDDALFKNPYVISFLDGNGWNLESTEFRIIYNQRGHQVLRMIGINTRGETRTLVEETSETFIDYTHKQFHREVLTSNSSSSGELIWMSERDGWNHLYLYDLETGKLKNQITKGEWLVRDIDHIDEVNRKIWIKVFGAVPGQDPYYAHLARVNFDGSDFKIITEGDGTHAWTFDPDRKTFVDTWSRMDKSPKSVLRDAETGRELLVIDEGSDLSWLLWPLPERFEAPGRDSKTMIHGLIFRPMDMNNNTKYPVIERIYAGPQDFYVPKAFATDSAAHQLANEGFVVVLIDGMGTNWRSKAFHNKCHKNLKDAGFPDRIAWIKAAAATRPWMDIERVGIFGTSAGGQNSMAALLHHNDFYSVAVSDSGCHDNRVDKLWWNEAWMGWPVDKSYEDSSNVVHAGKLQGKLQLVVGELDTNVDPASTMQVVNALISANKDHELLFIPGEGHGVGGYSPYAIRKRNEFLSRHLKGEKP